MLMLRDSPDELKLAYEEKRQATKTFVVEGTLY